MKIRLTLGAAQDPPGWFGLVWEHEGACYPYLGYMDFGADVLGQWTVAARELLRGAESAALPFVEGDYGLRVSRVDPAQTDTLAADVVVLPDGVDPPVSWPTTVGEFATLVLETAETICDQLPDAGELPTDAKRLRELFDEVQA